MSNKWNTPGGENIKDEKIMWEDLMQLKDSSVEAILGQQHLTMALIESAKGIISQKPAIKEAVVGLLKSYTDITNIIAENMKNHITMDDEGIITDYKKGEIDINSDDYLEFIKISSNYIHAQEQVVNLSFTGYTEVLTLITEVDPTLVSQTQVDALSKEYVKGVKQTQKIMKGFVDGTAKQPTKRKSKSRKKRSK